MNNAQANHRPRIGLPRHTPEVSFFHHFRCWSFFCVCFSLFKMAREFESLDATLRAHLPEQELGEVLRILYGSGAEPLALPRDCAAASSSPDGDELEVKGFKFPCDAESVRSPRIVRVGLVQNTVKVDTSLPVLTQYVKSSLSLSLFGPFSLFFFNISSSSSFFFFDCFVDMNGLKRRSGRSSMSLARLE